METLKRNWIGFLFALIVFLSMWNCNNNLNKDLKRQKDNVVALNKENVTYRTKNGDLVISVNTLQYDKKQLIDLVFSKDEKLNEMRKKFSSVKTIIKYNTETKFDTILVSYKDSIPCNFNKTDSIKTKWYKFNYNSNQKGVVINDFTTYDSIKHVFGTKRKWLFGKETQTMDLSHSNPNVKDYNIQQIEVPENKSFVEKYYIKEILSFALGVWIAK